ASEEAARLAAIERAVVERARLEAEHAARRLAVEATQVHELELERLRTERATRRLRRSLWAGLAVVLLAGSASAHGVARHRAASGPGPVPTQLEQEVRELEARYEARRRVRLAELDTMRSELGAEVAKLGAAAAPLAAVVDRVARARERVEAERGDDASVDAFEDALRSLRGELVKANRNAELAELDARHALATATLRKLVRPAAALSEAEDRAVSARSRIDGGRIDERSLAAYDEALAALERELARQPRVAVSIGAPPPPAEPPLVVKCRSKWDPLCPTLPE
ncbi:MAG: hypothetical protein HY908_31840, partial [Myxococcales bacterium]|nr:hypothetical protein [Myxococcales bacterium]